MNRLRWYQTIKTVTGFLKFSDLTGPRNGNDMSLQTWIMRFVRKTFLNNDLLMKGLPLKTWYLAVVVVVVVVAVVVVVVPC